MENKEKNKNYIKIAIVILIVILLALLFTTCLSFKDESDLLCSCAVSGQGSTGEGFIHKGDGGSGTPGPVVVTPGGNGTDPNIPPVDPPKPREFTAELYDYDNSTRTLRVLVESNETLSRPSEINTVIFENINDATDNGTGTVTGVVAYTPKPQTYLVSIQGVPLNTPEAAESYTYSISNGATTGTPGTVNYPFEDGTGAAGDPFTMEHIVQFDALRYFTNGNGSGLFFQLDTDLEYPDDWNNASNTYMRAGNDDSGWDPIGTDNGDISNINEEDGFDGSFDGDSHTLTKFYIDESDSDAIGIFGVVAEDSEIKNIKLDLTGQEIVGKDVVGGLVGLNNNGTIQNSSVVGGTIRGNECVGGLVGANAGSIKDSSAGSTDLPLSRINVIGLDSVGGFVGSNNEGTIATSFVVSQVSGTGTSSNPGKEIGGFIGYTSDGNLVLNNSSVNSSVTNTEYSSEVGGVIGRNINTTITHTEQLVYSEDITGLDHVGGFIGRNQGKIEGTSTKLIIVNGTITGNDCVGGVIGENYDNETSGMKYNGSSVSGNNSIGGLIGSNEYCSVSDSIVDSGDSANPVEITGNTNVGGFVGQNKDFGVTGPINNSNVNNTSVVGLVGVGGFIGDNNGTIESSAVGSSAVPVNVSGVNLVGGFIGVNNAGGIITTSTVVSDVTGTGTAATKGDYIGGFIGSNAADLTLTNSTVNSTLTTSNSNYVGGVFGGNWGTITINENTVLSKNIEALNFSGGFIGVNFGKINNVNTLAVNGTVEGDRYVGGLIGSNHGAALEKMTYNGTLVSGNTYVGGLIGSNVFNNAATDIISTSKVDSGNPASPAEIKGHSEVGGFIGNNNGTITTSTVVSKVVGTGMKTDDPKGMNIGGFIGNNSAALTLNNSTVNSTVTGTENSNNVGGVFGKNSGTIMPSETLVFSKYIAGNDNVGGFIGNNTGTVAGTASYTISTTRDVIGNNCIGGFIGMNSPTGVLNNVSSSGNVTGYTNVGGLVGQNGLNGWQGQGFIDNSSATGKEIKSTMMVPDLNLQTNVGGLVGQNFGSIRNSTSTGGKIMAGGNNVGGLIGFNTAYGALDNVSSSNEIDAENCNQAGGLIGWNTAKLPGKINDTDPITGTTLSASGDVKGLNRTGGLIGGSGNELSESGSTFYTTGNVIGNTDVGGLIGDAVGNVSTQTGDIYANGTVIGKINVGGLVGSSRSVENALYNGTSVTGESGIGGLIGYASGSVKDSSSVGDVSATGSGNSIGGLIGVFAPISVGCVIENSSSSGEVNAPSGTKVGGLVGALGRNDCTPRPYTSTIIESYSKSNVFGSGSVGGLVGEAVPNPGGITKINKSHAEGDVTGSGGGVGGLVGYVTKETVPGDNGFLIDECYASGIVGGKSGVGGLIGYGISSNISNSKFNGTSVTGESNVGGLVGYMSIDSGGDIKINNSYATGDVTGTAVSSSYAGGLVGGTAVTPTTQLIMDMCYASGDVSGNGYVGGLVGELIRGEISNSVALNPNVLGTGNIGRIGGPETDPSNVSYINNYGLNKMNPVPWTNEINGKNGEDVDSDDADTQGFFDGTGTIDGTTSTTLAWDFSSGGVWKWDASANRPILAWET
ncbi:beta strand repeat-containing protein [Methanolapillus ohkumae]|uniref:GLUG domain-containing protein n=1 Tax=Methanolapillus ohkumae TaxID=3028298 RepID=A0AA96V6F3_9EURY|nr:hypothetical protein MsAm2_01300 [Methanosarcinaceae archaeon Am2]